MTRRVSTGVLAATSATPSVGGVVIGTKEYPLQLVFSQATATALDLIAAPAAGHLVVVGMHFVSDAASQWSLREGTSATTRFVIHAAAREAVNVGPGAMYIPFDEGESLDLVVTTGGTAPGIVIYYCVAGV